MDFSQFDQRGRDEAGPVLTIRQPDGGFRRLRAVSGVWEAADGAFAATSVAAVPARARQAEALLQDQPWSEATAHQAALALQAEFTPLSDLRASSQYRHAVLGNLARRFWLESQGFADVSLDTLQLEALA